MPPAIRIRGRIRRARGTNGRWRAAASQHGGRRTCARTCARTELPPHGSRTEPRAGTTTASSYSVARLTTDQSSVPGCALPCPTTLRAYVDAGGMGHGCCVRTRTRPTARESPSTSSARSPARLVEHTAGVPANASGRRDERAETVGDRVRWGAVGTGRHAGSRDVIAGGPLPPAWRLAPRLVPLTARLLVLSP